MPRRAARRPWPRAAWFSSEIPPLLDAATSCQLVAANKGFAVTPRLPELERILREGVAEPRRLDVPTKARRAELAELQRITQELRAVLRGLHPRSRNHLVGTLAEGWGWDDQDLHRLREALGPLLLATGMLLAELPRGGAPPKARRDGLIRDVVAWVDRLEPDRARQASRAAITRDAARDPIHIPLRSPADKLALRRRDTVKIICKLVGTPLKGDVPRIMREVLSEKPR